MSPSPTMTPESGRPSLPTCNLEHFFIPGLSTGHWQRAWKEKTADPGGQGLPAPVVEKSKGQSSWCLV